MPGIDKAGGARYPSKKSKEFRKETPKEYLRKARNSRNTQGIPEKGKVRQGKEFKKPPRILEKGKAKECQIIDKELKELMLIKMPNECFMECRSVNESDADEFISTPT